ncbi:uncharacterized protein TRAVEDRAFT_54562 [Trametes versicolor FP-101664 SS1]|uniref:Uncharacterized protein n=1 Tax=Trametes versicolor (strain FP-101664) TaxID=717944 RepID=R7S765_TRAVS|nr:uncharacterized protein TRAVEDRAFT_54562 [Trametes versicolor FP-101664 SS1]EIW51445.1 hypothetical protein TRAVEDRAFT_54562 [Trametes versicolor FP-101664 SS1]
MPSLRLPFSCMALSLLDGHTDTSSPAALAAHTRRRPSPASSTLPESLAPYSTPLDDPTTPRTSLRLWDLHSALSFALLDVLDVPAAPSLGQQAGLASRKTTPFGAANLARIMHRSTPRPQRAASGKNWQVLASYSTSWDRLRALTSTGSRKNASDPRSCSQTRIWAHHGPNRRRAICAANTDSCDARQHSQHTSSGIQPAYRPGSPPAPKTANTHHTYTHTCQTILHALQDVALAPKAVADRCFTILI